MRICRLRDQECRRRTGGKHALGTRVGGGISVIIFQ